MRKRYYSEFAIVMIVAAVLISIYVLYGPLRPISPNNFQDVAFMPQVKGCAEEGTRGTIRAIMPQQDPMIEFNESGIKYSRAINHLCCRKVEVQKELSKDRINIFEVWSGPGCRCECFSEIGATIGNVPRGKYAVNVYEKGIAPNGMPMERRLIVSKNVYIK